MVWDHLSITKPHLVYVILGGFTTLFMLCSTIIKERMYIGEASVATLVGIIFGPHAANLINPAEWGSVDIVTLEFSRIVLVVQCFAVGVELPKFYMEKHWRSVFFLLVPVMTAGWLITGLFIWWLIEPLGWVDSLVVAACVTATDPVLASSVVGKGKFAKRVPKHLRDLLSAESGCNDGMAFPFIYLALYLIHDHQDVNKVSFHWIVYTILYECVFGAVYGFIIGYLARHGIKYAEKHELIDRESFLVFYFVLALFCAGSGSILGIDDLLVGFAAGVGFSNDGWFTQKTEESHVSNVIDLLLNLTYFVYFGTIIPWDMFNNYDIGLSAWRLAVLAIFVILFRRIPIMMALKPVIPDIKTWREALFAGHFGPIGVGAIFIAILARAELETGTTIPLGELPPADSENFTLLLLVWPIVAFLVVASIIVHGSSIAVFTLGKRINTLTLTMSYTAANDDGPSWMNRLPRLSSVSKSQARTMSDTDAEELKMPDLPPGALPPVGITGQFLRRVKDEENQTSSKQGSRSSSLGARRRKKKWDDGRGPGGPIAQSAIFPQRLSPTEQSAVGHQETAQVEPSQGGGQNSAPLSTTEVASTISPERRDNGKTPSDNLSIRTASSRRSTGAARDAIQVYDEGDHIVIENRDGEVLSVKPVPGTSVAEHAKALKSRLETETGASSWTIAALRKKINHWREEETAKRKDKEKTARKHEPAWAFQYGNTVIVENEDGEVVKTYELPSDKPETDLISQSLKYMGMGGLTRAAEKTGEPDAEAGGPSRPARPRKKSVVNEEEEDDDRHIRFTINGVGQRMTKEDFIKQMCGFDKSTRREIVDQLAAGTVKTLAVRDLQGLDQGALSESRGTPGAPTAQSSQAQDKVRLRPPSPERPVMSKVPSRDAPETEVERRRRMAALEGVDGSAEETDESPAERRRREAALRVSETAEEEDVTGEGDDTRTAQPPRRGIRFADAPERGRV